MLRGVRVARSLPATGAGKSVCMNSIIASLLYKFSPDEMRMVMIDPKVVELQMYNTLPHLVVPVVTDPKKVILALRWVVQEMEKRYKIFAQENVKNIHAFNKRSPKKGSRLVRTALPWRSMRRAPCRVSRNWRSPTSSATSWW